MNDGGPAFPVHLDDFRDAVEHPLPGMSLRDWFAGMYLTSIPAEAYDNKPETFARVAYRLADAMLAQREKTKSDSS